MGMPGGKFREYSLRGSHHGSKEHMFPGVQISEEEFMVRGKHKVERFLVPHDGYEKLLMLQKDHYGLS
jgi:hypothetical protein